MPITKEKKEEQQETEKKHEIGTIEPIIDVVGWRVWKSETDYIDFPRDSYGNAVILSEILAIKKLAQE